MSFQTHDEQGTADDNRLEEPSSSSESSASTALERLRATEERYRTLVRSIDIGFCLIKMLYGDDGFPDDYLFLEANPAFEEHTGLRDAVGKTIRELAPDIDTSWFRIYGDVARTGQSTRFENHDPALSRWFDVYAQSIGQAEERTVGIFFTDITARRRGELAIRESEERLREQGEYLRRFLESSPDCIKTLDLQGRLLSMTEGGQRVMEINDFSLVCEMDWMTFWKDENTKDAVRTAIATANAGGTGRFQGLCPTFKGTPKWWDVVVVPILGADGRPEQLLGISRDITDQKQSEERERVSASREQNRLNDIFANAPAFMTVLSGPVHRYDMANRLYLQLIGHPGEDIIGKTVAEVIPEMVEQGFIGLLDHVYQTGETHYGSDTSVSFRVDDDSPLDEHFVNFTFQPLRDEAGSISGILVHGVDLTDRKLLEQEREALLAETRLKADREMLLNRIGSAIRASLEPNSILQSVVELLGVGLNADRCYFARYNQSRDIARASPEWMREGSAIQPLAGRNLQMSSYSVDRDDSYLAGATQAVEDVVAYAPDNAETLLSLNIRALLRVPIEVGDQMTALAVSMAFEPRHWTQDEVRFVENVATLLHSALEAARVQQRERNIALQLQEALQPPPPNNLPGLALASYYRPALAEASVGGDFYDVFPDEEGCTALVVADLSGKGLQAASQVATVRNMMRFALYASTTLAEAVTGLHRALVKHDLLTGFATLFIGLYDENEKTLTYVNCGQEAGLLWRAASGDVVRLSPTGSVLGGFGDGDFTEKVVALDRGDVLALFTDGLTEVGPSRKTMLEIDGVSHVLQECCANNSSGGLNAPQSIVDGLIAGIDDFARGGARDDIALLVGVVRESQSK